jgi:hypothetical protein
LLWVYCHYLEMRQTVIFNNWQSQSNTTSQANRIWSEHLIWPWKATIWIRFIKGKLVFLKMKKQWELLQKVKMKQIYWCCHALKKTGFSYQYQFSLLQFLLWQQQLTIIVLVQFISYIQCSFNYMSDSQKSSSSSWTSQLRAHLQVL